MEMKNMQYWKRKNTLPGLNYESDNKLPNGLAKSSAFQKTEDALTAAKEKGIRNPKASAKKPKPPVKPTQSAAETVKKTKASGSKKETKSKKKDYIIAGGSAYATMRPSRKLPRKKGSFTTKGGITKAKAASSKP